MASVHTGKRGERELGRFLLQNGYLAWRTQQNRGSIRDDESPDVKPGMVPEHMLVERDGESYLDGYYIDRSKHPKANKDLYPLDRFTVIPNLRLECKQGYEYKTYNKPFNDWIKKLKRETPEGDMWALFYRRKWSGCWRVCFKVHGVKVLTITEEETRKALPIIEKVALSLRKKYDGSTTG